MPTLSRSLPALAKSARLRKLSLLAAILLFTACSSVDVPYKAYEGDPRPADELALVKGDFHFRKDWLNSYVDAVRFLRVDGQVIENSRDWEVIQLSPGERELEVYYSWDMGARIGLAPALVSYASSRESISRTLRLRAEPGETYSVKANPVFDGDPMDLGSLVHVDFWIEDSEGRVVLSREEGRFRPVR